MGPGKPRAGGRLYLPWLAMATKILTGEEQLIYYHHEIAIIGRGRPGLDAWSAGLALP